MYFHVYCISLCVTKLHNIRLGFKIEFYSYTFIICGLLEDNCLPKWPVEKKKLGITEPYLHTATTDGYWLTAIGLSLSYLILDRSSSNSLWAAPACTDQQLVSHTRDSIIHIIYLYVVYAQCSI